MYLLLELSEDFGKLPATLPDIESEIICNAFPKKQSIWFRAIKSTVHEFCALN